MSDGNSGLPPSCVHIATLPPQIAHALAIVQHHVTSTNTILANLEAQAATHRDDPAWQRHWTTNLRDLAALNELLQMFDAPVVRLIAHERARAQERLRSTAAATLQALRN